MKNLKYNLLPIITLVAFPMISNANQSTDIKPIEVVSITKSNDHIKIGIISSSKLNKIYFGSGLGGYDPENSHPSGSNTEDLAMESVMALRSLCNQADSASTLDDLELQLSTGQNILLDINVFSNTDQLCLRQLSQK